MTLRTYGDDNLRPLLEEHWSENHAAEIAFRLRVAWRRRGYGRLVALSDNHSAAIYLQKKRGLMRPRLRRYLITISAFSWDIVTYSHTARLLDWDSREQSLASWFEEQDEEYVRLASGR